MHDLLHGKEGATRPQRARDSVPPSRMRTTLALAALVAAAAAAPANASISHTVAPGETLSSVAAANGVSPGALAAYNGLAADAWLLAGQTIEIPASSTAPSSSGTAVSPGAPPSAVPPYWTAPVYCPACPSAQAYLASNAAANWNAMRQASLSQYGIDLYPAGPLSAYRSYGQQLYLYELYLSGQGALAALPGTSTHEYGAAVDLADPAMRSVIDQIGAVYGWAKTEAPAEWWHVNYVGP
jgi:LysM domain-containing protein/D-alanyl-D-alanine carboxypeptidase-like protein